MFSVMREHIAAPFPSIRLSEVLSLPIVLTGVPEVITGKHLLDRPIRWVHASDLVDVSHLLNGGELVLTTGLGLPDDLLGVRLYIENLVRAQVAALIIELGRRFVATPEPILLAAQEFDLPVILLHHEVKFVDVTEAIHKVIVEKQLSLLEWRDQLHRRFATLAVDGADIAEIVATAAELAKGPVVLESRSHQVLAFDAQGVEIGPILAEWDRHSASLNTEVSSGWIVVPVAARNAVWGRLIAIDPLGVDPVQVLERAAMALAVNRLSERDQLSTRLREHQEIISALCGDDDYVRRSAREIEERAAAIGVPLIDRQLVGIALRAQVPNGLQTKRISLDDVERVVASAVDVFDVLIDASTLGEVRIIASFSVQANRTRLLRTFARKLRLISGSVPAIIGVGSAASTLADVGRSLREARYVIESTSHQGECDYLQWFDIGVSGLIYLLRDDVRLQDFVQRQLGRIMAHDQANGTQFSLTLKAYLDSGRSKTHAAQHLHLSRAALYARLEQISVILSRDLEDAETCLALQFALAAHPVVATSVE